jgi:hypothetical protein
MGRGKREFRIGRPAGRRLARRWTASRCCRRRRRKFDRRPPFSNERASIQQRHSVGIFAFNTEQLSRERRVWRGTFLPFGLRPPFWSLYHSPWNLVRSQRKKSCGFRIEVAGRFVRQRFGKTGNPPILRRYYLRAKAIGHRQFPLGP